MLAFKGTREPIRVKFLFEPMITTLNLIAEWSSRYGIDVIVTSMDDHKHKPKSLHGQGFALDFCVDRSQVPGGGFEKPMDSLVGYLRLRLGLGFDILWKSDAQHQNHCHVEFDIKQRRGAWTG